MVTISKSLFIYMLLMIIILAGWYFYTTWIFHKAKLDKETSKKWKKICKWEFRNSVDQEKLLIKEFIEKYTEEHNIDWNEQL